MRQTNMNTMPTRKMPTPITSGGPKPNQATPLYELSGSLRSEIERISSQISSAEPISGPTPISSRLDALRGSCLR